MRFFSDMVMVTALLITFSYLFGYLYRYFQFKPQFLRELSYGVFFALITLMGMMNPVELSPGIIIDGRSLVIAFSTLFGGVLSGLITSLAAILYRIYLGGMGVLPGIIVIVLSLFAGFIFRYIFVKNFIKNKYLFFSLLGLAAAGIWAVAVQFLPDRELVRALTREVYLTVFLFFPFISLFLGSLIMREIKQYSMEKDLISRIKQNKMVLAVSTDGYFDWNVKTGEMYFDPNCYILAGYVPGDFPMEYEEWIKRIHPEDQRRMRKKMQSFTLGIEKYFDEEFRFRRKDRKWMWIREKALITERDIRGNTVKILGTYSNIDKFKDIQHELNRLHLAIEQAAEVIMITDVEGIIQYVNPSFFKLTGYDRNETIGRKAGFLKSEGQNIHLYRDLWASISAGDVWKGQLRNRKKNGTEFIEEVVISPVREEDGEIAAFVAIKKDITKDIIFKEQLVQNQKMQAVGQLAGGVAHDFNNMLTGIMTASLMLKKNVSHDEKLMKYISIIDEAVSRSADLTKSLLNFSRRQPQALNILDIHNSINNSVKLMKSTMDKQISIVTELKAERSVLIGDSSQIENSILNICINATHAIEKEGCITIKSDLVFLDQKDCEQDVFDISPGKYIHLSISDDGCGMDSQTLNKVFEPFFTTKKSSKGTGLGLSSVYAMIKQHKGTLVINSEVGKGSDFNLYFPIVDDHEIEIVEESSETQEIEREDGCILLVDDEELIRKTVEDMLIDSGYEVLVADDGEMALSIFRENTHKIDLVILDMIMPKMNGFECFKAMRIVNPDVKVIVETGYLEEEKLTELNHLGIQGVIYKPGSISVIKSAIKDALNRDQ